MKIKKVTVSSESDLFANKNLLQSISKSNLIIEQHKDPAISILFEKAVKDSEISKNPVCYFVQKDILMRKWRPPDVPADDEWGVKYQIVIPKVYRNEILSLAHETPLAGHLGSGKTMHRVTEHFYWPLIRKDVAEFCRSCYTCQVVGKPNQTIPKAPLHPIPAFEEPFSRVIIDCIGPLPKTKSGNQLRIKQFSTLAYHRESQGALERFHQTLKTIIKTYYFDTEKCWDKGIHLLLFAARQAVKES